jgi:hypothetical protein
MQTPTVSIESAPSDEFLFCPGAAEEQPNALSPGPLQLFLRPHSASSLPTIDEKTIGQLLIVVGRMQISTGTASEHQTQTLVHGRITTLYHHITNPTIFHHPTTFSASPFAL